MRPLDARSPPLARRLVIAMVGLPARGKSHIARRLGRFLSWLGHPTRIFNVGSYRRALLGAGQLADFFDPDDAEARAARASLAAEALDDLDAWLAERRTTDDDAIAIYDATNTTRAQRDVLVDRCRARGHDLLFIESICDDPAVIDANVRATKLDSPDYVGVESDVATADFYARIGNYARVYEPLDRDRDRDVRFIQLLNLGSDVRLHRVDGYLPGRIVAFLLNIHVTPRRVWLTRHGESLANAGNRLGGDTALTSRGRAYAHDLVRFVEEKMPPSQPLTVWTSSLARTRETAAGLPFEPFPWRALDEIDAGVCDGMTYEEIERAMPEEWAARRADKLRYRYPRGESYLDVIERLSPVILELERLRTPVLVVSHQAVLRVLYGYFMDRAPEVCPKLDVPLHTIIELEIGPFGCRERRHALGATPPRHRRRHG